MDGALLLLGTNRLAEDVLSLLSLGYCLRIISKASLSVLLQ
jgi:hypothetical protein